MYASEFSVGHAGGEHDSELVAMELTSDRQQASAPDCPRWLKVEGNNEKNRRPFPTVSPSKRVDGRRIRALPSCFVELSWPDSLHPAVADRITFSIRLTFVNPKGKRRVNSLD